MGNCAIGSKDETKLDKKSKKKKNKNKKGIELFEPFEGRISGEVKGNSNVKCSFHNTIGSEYNYGQFTPPDTPDRMVSESNEYTPYTHRESEVNDTFLFLDKKV